MSLTENAVVRLSPDDFGCYVDGWWGQYASVRVCELAETFGGPALLSYGTSDAMADPYDDRDVDFEVDAADDAVAWMNDHLAPAGYSFDWCEGELFLWSDDEWAEVGE